MIPDLLRNIVYLIVCSQQQRCCLFHTITVQVILKGLPVFLAEQLSQIGTVHIILLTQFPKCKIFRIVLTHFTLHFSQHPSGHILSELCQILCVIQRKLTQMRLTSAHDSLLKGALTDKLQDFLLVDTIILFCRHRVGRIAILDPLVVLSQLGNWEMLMQSLLNLLMFLPMGFFFRNRKPWQVPLGALGISLFIEGMQYLTMRGMFDTLDILLYIPGISLGALLFRLLRPKIE